MEFILYVCIENIIQARPEAREAGRKGPTQKWTL